MKRVNKHNQEPHIGHPAVHLGARVRSLRTAAKLTQDQLARLASVSKAMLSQIEQDKVNPTVAVMLRVARALNVPIGELLETATGDHEFRLIHGDDDAYTVHSTPLCTIRALSPVSLKGSFEFYRVTLERSGELLSQAHFPGTMEVLHVAKGKMHVASGEMNGNVSKGDSVYYRGDVPHSLRNISSGQAVAYMMVRYGEK